MVTSRHLSLAQKTTEQEITFKNRQCSRKKENTSKDGEKHTALHLPWDPRKATTKTISGGSKVKVTVAIQPAFIVNIPRLSMFVSLRTSEPFANTVDVKLYPQAIHIFLWYLLTMDVCCNIPSDVMLITLFLSCSEQERIQRSVNLAVGKMTF